MMTVSSTELRRSPRRVWSEVDKGNPVTVTRRGKPSVVIVPYALWETMSRLPKAEVAAD